MKRNALLNDEIFRDYGKDGIDYSADFITSMTRLDDNIADQIRMIQAYNAGYLHAVEIAQHPDQSNQA